MMRCFFLSMMASPVLRTEVCSRHWVLHNCDRSIQIVDLKSGASQLLPWKTSTYAQPGNSFYDMMTMHDLTPTGQHSVRLYSLNAKALVAQWTHPGHILFSGCTRAYFDRIWIAISIDGTVYSYRSNRGKIAHLGNVYGSILRESDRLDTAKVLVGAATTDNLLTLLLADGSVVVYNIERKAVMAVLEPEEDEPMDNGQLAVSFSRERNEYHVMVARASTIRIHRFPLAVAEQRAGHPQTFRAPGIGLPIRVSNIFITATQFVAQTVNGLVYLWDRDHETQAVLTSAVTFVGPHPFSADSLSDHHGKPWTFER